MISAILFDLDNTLIDRDEAFRRLLQSEFPKQHSFANTLLALDNHGHGCRDQLINKWNERHQTPLNVQRLGTEIARHLTPNSRLLNQLSKLSDHFQLGIISNGNSVSQISKWKTARLDTIIPANRFWISEAVGVSKPAQEIFHLACESICVTPGSTLFIGDHPIKDIQGARSAGLQALHVAMPLTAECIYRIGLRTTKGLS